MHFSRHKSGPPPSYERKVTNRLAIGLAGPYWGSQEKECAPPTSFPTRTPSSTPSPTKPVRTKEELINDLLPPPSLRTGMASGYTAQMAFGCVVRGAGGVALAFPRGVERDSSLAQKGGRERDHVAAGHQILCTVAQRAWSCLVETSPNLRPLESRGLVCYWWFLESNGGKSGCCGA